MEQNSIRWLLALRFGCLFILVTGILPWLAIFEQTQEPWRFFFDVLTWPPDNSLVHFSMTEKQLSAILGGVLCGWAWLMYLLADPNVFNQRIRCIMIQSTWVWFSIDSLGSVLSGLPLNAVSNVGFLLMLLVPLTRLKAPGG